MIRYILRKFGAKGLCFCAKQMARVRNRSEYGGDYVDWFGMAKWFDALYWKHATRNK